MTFGSLREIPDLWKETYDLVAQVPRGMVTTYGEVAKALGDIVASRFVGKAMSMNDDIVRVPCRRVVCSDGRVGGYTGGGEAEKIRLLRQEGIPIRGDTIADLDSHLFRDFRTRRPLDDLRRRQARLRDKLSLEPITGKVRKVAGVDIAYRGEHCFAALVVLDRKSGLELEHHVIEDDARFPYVPTYLAYRELPVVSQLMELLDDQTVLFYDGNGTLHPEGFGVASHAAVEFDVPVVGVAKSLLCGQVIGPARMRVTEVRVGGKVAGFSVRKSTKSKPVYVSPGGSLSSRQALDLAKEFMIHRIPEPLRLAHVLATEARRSANHI